MPGPKREGPRRLATENVAVPMVVHPVMDVTETDPIVVPALVPVGLVAGRIVEALRADPATIADPNRAMVALEIVTPNIAITDLEVLKDKAPAAAVPKAGVLKAGVRAIEMTNTSDVPVNTNNVIGARGVSIVTGRIIEDQGLVAALVHTKDSVTVVLVVVISRNGVAIIVDRVDAISDLTLTRAPVVAISKVTAAPRIMNWGAETSDTAALEVATSHIEAIIVVRTVVISGVGMVVGQVVTIGSTEDQAVITSRITTTEGLVTTVEISDLTVIIADRGIMSPRVATSDITPDRAVTNLRIVETGVTKAEGWNTIMLHLRTASPANTPSIVITTVGDRTTQAGMLIVHRWTTARRVEVRVAPADRTLAVPRWVVQEWEAQDSADSTRPHACSRTRTKTRTAS